MWAPPRPGARPGWRWCSGCQQLAYTGFEAGSCAVGGTHDHTTSEEFHLYPANLADGQPGWRRCRVCHALVSARLSTGRCPGGGRHAVMSGRDYVVPHIVVPDDAESGWRWCARCQGLVHAREPGICAELVPHDVGDSPLYGVHLTAAAGGSAPEGAEPGWRRCHRCRLLVRGESADEGPGAPVGGSGLCPDGVPHDVAESPAYAVSFVAPVVPPIGGPPPSGPRIAVTEDAAQIVVDGTGFAPGIGIVLTFLLGARELVVPLTADPAGAFRHVVTPVTAVLAGVGGAVVLAQDDGGAVASGRLTAFVPVLPGPPD